MAKDHPNPAAQAQDLPAWCDPPGPCEDPQEVWLPGLPLKQQALAATDALAKAQGGQTATAATPPPAGPGHPNPPQEISPGLMLLGFALAFLGVWSLRGRRRKRSDARPETPKGQEGEG